MKYKIMENDSSKILKSDVFNYVFDKRNGYTAYWGRTKEEDPIFSPMGPMIADIEVTTSCDGFNTVGCVSCYKSNTTNGSNMSLATFKKVFNNLPRTLTQIAFGVDARCEANPEIWDIMDYCRNNGTNEVIPNITVANISDSTADKLSKYCGAVAVSRYENKDYCYDSIKKLTDRGMKQVNMHHIIHKDNIEMILETFDDYKNDPRLEKLNCIVLLSLKQKGRGLKYIQADNEAFKLIIDTAFEMDIPIGFDSCSQPKFEKAINDREDFDKLIEWSEPCESTLFSLYVSVDGKYYPCSFCEGIDDWNEGIDIINTKDFLKDVWYNKYTEKFRNALIKGKRSCPVYQI